MCDTGASYTNPRQVKDRECLHVRSSKRDWNEAFHDPERFVLADAIRKTSTAFCIVCLYVLASRIDDTFVSKVDTWFLYADYTLLKLHNTARCQNITIFQLYSFIYLFFSIFSTILSLLIKNIVQCKQKYTLPTLNSISLRYFFSFFVFARTIISLFVDQ